MDISQLVTNCRSHSTFDAYLIDNDVRRKAEDEIQRLRILDPVLCSAIT